MSYWEHRKPVRRLRAVDIVEVARASVRLLDEGGLRALTLRSVAQQVGVAPASLYSRVESVDDLFDLALEHRVPGHQQHLRGGLIRQPRAGSLPAR